MSTRVVPGSGAILSPNIETVNYSVTSIDVINGGSGYASTDPPKITIENTVTPITEGIFYPVISGGAISRIVVLSPGFGYYSLSQETGTRIGIATTSYATGTLDILMKVGAGIGSAIYENGYNNYVPYTGIVTGISTTISEINNTVLVWQDPRFLLINPNKNLNTALKLRQSGIDLTRMSLAHFRNSKTEAAIYSTKNFGPNPYKVNLGNGNEEDISWLLGG